MKSIGVVVLNYINYNETINCIESVLKQEGVRFYIVIVENGSTNASRSILENKYKNYDNVELIPLPKNLGYAKGNNIGISRLKNMGYDYIFVVNSDVVLGTNKVLKQLVNEDEWGVGLLNPVIRNTNGSIDQRVAYKKKYLNLRIFEDFFF